MKLFKFSIIVFLFAGIFNLTASNPFWGATGHRTIGAIAQEYLTPKAQKEINLLLNGESLALVSTFGDDIKSDKRFKQFDPWHYVNMPLDVDYKNSIKSPEGDVYQGITTCIDTLKNKNTLREDKVFYLKLLVHLVGDLHQPMHVGRVEDKGGNTIQLQWFKKGTNLHRVWDSDMIEQFGMGYKELADNREKISENQFKEWQKGSVLDWVNDTHQLTAAVYNSVNVGDNLGYEYQYEHFELVRTQLQKAGIRLAKLLNDLYN